jgi:hypothetical protein
MRAALIRAATIVCKGKMDSGFRRDEDAEGLAELREA